MKEITLTLTPEELDGSEFVADWALDCHDREEIFDEDYPDSWVWEPGRPQAFFAFLGWYKNHKEKTQ